MAARSAIGKGLEQLKRQPAMLLAEIIWRWCFAAGACIVALATAVEYLNSIPVSWREQLLLGSGSPLLILAGMEHAMRGSAGRLAVAVIVAATATTVLWMFCAALGRWATLNALLPRAGRTAYKPLLGLSFLRAGLFLAAVLAALGGLVLAGFAAPAGDSVPSVLAAAILLTCAWVVWALLNWLLSLAAVFVMRDGKDTFAAMFEAVDLVRTAFAEVVLTSLPFLLLHYLALAAAVIAGVLVFDLMLRVSPAAGWALAAIAAGYFAYADFLYIGRLAAYVAMAGPQGGALAASGPEGGSLPQPAPSNA